MLGQRMIVGDGNVQRVGPDTGGMKATVNDSANVTTAS